MIRCAIWIFIVMAIQTSLVGGIRNYWKEFDVKSSNQQFVAKVRVIDKMNSTDKSIWKYKISVFSLLNHTEKLLWERDYAYTGVPYGVLSNDGLHFAYISYYFLKDLSVVIIHNKGGVLDVLGKDFRLKRSSLEKVTVNKRKEKLWLKPFLTRDKFSGCRFDIINGKSYLVFFTRDGQIHFMDPEVGKLVEYKDI